MWPKNVSSSPGQLAPNILIHACIIIPGPFSLADVDLNLLSKKSSVRPFFHFSPPFRLPLLLRGNTHQVPLHSGMES